MAAQVEVQTGEVGRKVGAGLHHMTPLTGSSNNLIEIPPISQSHILTPEPYKPAPGPKPRLTPKPFVVERNPTLKPIVAPKPQTKPRPESTRLAGYKAELPFNPKPQQPMAAGKPKPVSTNPNRPLSTSFRASNMLITGQTAKPVAQPFKPVPSFDLGDPSRPTPPVPAERQIPSRLAYSKSLKKPPAAEWSGTTNKEDDTNRFLSSRGGTSMTRAKSMGFLSEVVTEEEENQSYEVAVQLRPHPRASRPRPVSAIFLDSTTKMETPVPVPRWTARRPLSADLTSKFESIGLSLHRKSPKASTREDIPQEQTLSQRKESEKTHANIDGATPPVSDQSIIKKEEVTVTETVQDYSAVSIKSRIDLLDSSSSPGGAATDLLSPVQPVPETEPPVGVKQLIKQLTVDTTPVQSPVAKPSLKPRPLPLDLTKRFSSERLPDLGSVSLSDDRHDIISKDPQRRIEELAFGEQRTSVDSQEQLKKAPTPDGPEARLVLDATPKGNGTNVDVQTVRASLFENVVERHSVFMVDDGKLVNKTNDLLTSPSFRKGSIEDQGTVVTATYKDPVSPSNPLRVVHSFDTVQAVEESRAVSENIPSAQWEDKAMTLRSRRSEGTSSAVVPQQQPRYLRIGALQKWTDTGLEQKKGISSPLEEPEAYVKDGDGSKEGEQEEVAAAPKRLKMLQTEEQPKARATYYALTGQMQEPFSPVDSGTNAGDFDELSFRSAMGSSLGKILPVQKNPSLEEAFGKTSPDQVGLTSSHRFHDTRVLDGKMAEEAMEVEKKRELIKETERHKAKLKALEREKQRQVELEREAILEFERMRELEIQREFERQRQKAFEKEKREFDEKHRALDRQKHKEELERQEREWQRQQRELERQKKAQRENLREQERERQREQERQRQREEERESQLEKERHLLEVQKEKQKMEELERIKELERQQLLEFQKQKQTEKERQQLVELEKQRLREKKERDEAEKIKQMALEQELLRMREIEKERERQREMEREHQKAIEREKQKELERLRQRDLERERQRQRDLERERERQRDLERERQRQRDLEKERERQRDLEKERQRQRDLERERERQKDLERERERQKDLERERERQRDLERERQRQRDLERERQRQLDIERQELENQRLSQRELQKERQGMEDLERMKEMERLQLLEFEKQKQAEMDRIWEIEKRQLRETMEREEAERFRQIAKQQEAERQKLKEKQRKEEEERARLESSPLRPKVLDLDSVLRDDPFTAFMSQRSDPATRWKEPSGRPVESYKPVILDIDSFTYQARHSPSTDFKELFPVSGIQGVDAGFGARLQPQRDISWKVPQQTMVGSSHPVWTTSPQDPWELPPVANQPAVEPRKEANKVDAEQLLFRPEGLPAAPQRHWSSLLDERLNLDPFSKSSPDRVSTSSATQQMWFSEELPANWGDVESRRMSQGSRELNRMRSRSVSRRSAPSGSVTEGNMSRLRSRSTHREQDPQSSVQQKQSNGGEESRSDSGETPVHETDSQYGTWETGLRTDDSLTPATPSSESNLSPSPRKTSPPHTPGVSSSLVDSDIVDSVPPSSSSESQLPSFPDAPPTLLDNSALRSRAQLAKKRAPRTRPTRAARQNAAQSEGGTADNWLYQDSTEPKAASKDDHSEEQRRGADSTPAVAASQPQRIAMFPGMDPSALKAQLKKRGDFDSQIEAPTPPPSQLSRSPKSPFLPRAARVLPPTGGKDTGEQDSPQWLKELKSKKRLSQYESES